MPGGQSNDDTSGVSKRPQGPEYARHTDPENIDAILRIPTSYDLVYKDTYDRLQDSDPGGSRIVHEGHAHLAAQRSQTERLWAAAKDNAAVIPELIIIESIAKEYVKETMPSAYDSDKLIPVIGVDILKNPGDLLDLLAGAEKAYTPEYIEKHKEYWRGHSPVLEDIVETNRFDALHKILRVIYGGRWIDYRKAANFDFTTWHAEIDWKNEYPIEEASKKIARTVLGEGENVGEEKEQTEGDVEDEKM